MKTKVGEVAVIPDEVVSGGEEKTVSTKKPLPHYKEVPVTDDMAEGTKIFAEQYNAMRAALIEHKLMKAK